MTAIIGPALTVAPSAALTDAVEDEIGARTVVGICMEGAAVWVTVVVCVEVWVTVCVAVGPFGAA
ncbi:MAG: hypothetical protein JHC22_04540 [Thermoproteus sp.]|jgi:hypothetical protein|nr:hypothetical protein [Thermoproteus sp.]